MRFVRLLFVTIAFTSLFSTGEAGTLIFEKKRSSFERKLTPISLDLSEANVKDDKDTKDSKDAKSDKKTIDDKKIPVRYYKSTRIEYNHKTTMRVIKTSIGAVFFVAGCLFGVGLYRGKKN